MRNDLRVRLVAGRQGFCVRPLHAAEYEIAAAVTRSRRRKRTSGGLAERQVVTRLGRPTKLTRKADACHFLDPTLPLNCDNPIS